MAVCWGLGTNIAVIGTGRPRPQPCTSQSPSGSSLVPLQDCRRVGVSRLQHQVQELCACSPFGEAGRGPFVFGWLGPFRDTPGSSAFPFPGKALCPFRVPFRVPDPASSARAMGCPLLGSLSGWAARGGRMFVLWVLTGRAASDFPVSFLLCLNHHLRLIISVSGKGSPTQEPDPWAVSGGLSWQGHPRSSPCVLVMRCGGFSCWTPWMIGVGCGDEGVGGESQREEGWGMALPGMFSPCAPSPSLPRDCMQQGRPGAEKSINTARL